MIYEFQPNERSEDIEGTEHGHTLSSKTIKYMVDHCILLHTSVLGQVWGLDALPCLRLMNRNISVEGEIVGLIWAHLKVMKAVTS